MVKDIVLKVIPSKIAREFVKKHHYSGTVSNTSRLHFGCFLNGQLHGVMSYGSPMDKGKVIGLVQPSKWNEMLELNRMAFDAFLPRNSESRCIAVSIRLIKKYAPHVKWILSYADGVQCGDGAIYRAAGFKLTGIKKSTQIIRMPWGEIITRMTLTNHGKRRTEALKRLGLVDNGSASIKQFIEAGCKNLEGYQLRYILVIDPNAQITVPLIDYKKISELGATMYRGKKYAGVAQRSASDYQSEGDGRTDPPAQITPIKTPGNG